MLAFLISYGCGSTKQLSNESLDNELFVITGVTGCKESHSGTAVDSQIGEIHCEDVSFAYDYGRYGAVGPRTAEEDFRAAFDTYHFTKFFELVHIDKKVQPIFRDSVEVMKLYKKDGFSESTLYDCSTCNVVAALNFKGSTFYYPTTINMDQLENPPNGIEYFEEDGQVTKLFKDATGRIGAVIAKAPFRRNRDYLSISITESDLSTQQQKVLLQHIQLKKMK